MDKEIMDGYVIFPYGNNKFIRWVGKNELEIMEKKTIHISNEMINDKKIDVVKYVKDKARNEKEHYKQQRDSLIKDVEKLREKIEELKKYNSDLEQNMDKWIEEWHDMKVDNELLEVKLHDTKEDYRIVNSKYNYLTNHIKDKALHNPSVSRYIYLVHVIDDLERD